MPKHPISGRRRPVGPRALLLRACLFGLLICLQAGASALPPGVDAPGSGWQSPFVGAGSAGASNINFIPGVWTQTVWDDGLGPALYAAGNFITMSDVYSPGIARWDGSGWERVPLISERDGELRFTAWAMAEFQGELIVGGSFLDLNGQTVRSIVRFDGQSWQPLVGSQGLGVNGSVRALAVYQGELIVGGEFSQAGGLSVNGLARWTGMDWQTLPNPFQTSAIVRALTVHQGELIAGGSIVSAAPAINNVARWNGSSWQPLSGPSGQGVSQDSGFGVDVSALMTRPEGLFVGGRFARAGGITARNVALWNGSAWSALGPGLGGITHQVYALAFNDGMLFAGGSFPGSGGVDSPNVMAWDGAEWLALSGPNGAGAGLDTVLSLQAFGNEVYVAGLIDQAGGVQSTGIARWTGSEFARVTNSPVTGPMGGSPQTAMLWNGQLLVGGAFTEAGSSSGRGIAAWDGSAWQSLGEGLFGGLVNSLIEFQGELIAAGGFNFAPGSGQSPGRTVNRVARWDGSAWQTMANGLAGTVEVLHEHQGQLYAAGWFTAAGGFGGAPLARIARWNGSAWEAVDGGIANGVVWTLYSHEGELVAGGSFTQLGNGDPAQRVAIWNPEDGWRAMGSDLSSGAVQTLASLNGELYAGGSFGAPPSGSSPRFLARWDGDNWQPVTRGAGDELSWQVSHLAASDGELFIGGLFERIGSFDLHCVARYSPSRGWRRMSGPDGIGLRAGCGGVRRLLPLDQTVVAVGSLIVAGGQVAYRIGYWSRLEDELFGDRFEALQ